jgi:hypothetical protein
MVTVVMAHGMQINMGHVLKVDPEAKMMISVMEETSIQPKFRCHRRYGDAILVIVQEVGMFRLNASQHVLDPCKFRLQAPVRRIHDANTVITGMKIRYVVPIRWSANPTRNNNVVLVRLYTDEILHQPRMTT